MSRDALLEFLKNGNKAVTGSRQELMASTFTVEKKCIWSRPAVRNISSRLRKSR